MPRLRQRAMITLPGTVVATAHATAHATAIVLQVLNGGVSVGMRAQVSAKMP
jgi:hypothetical protein